MALPNGLPIWHILHLQNTVNDSITSAYLTAKSNFPYDKKKSPMPSETEKRGEDRNIFQCNYNSMREVWQSAEGQFCDPMEQV